LPRLHDKVFLFHQFLEGIRDAHIPEPKTKDAVAMRFFTDGGASNPTCPHARIASWSVVEDISQSERHQRKVADFFAITQTVLSSCPSGCFMFG